MFICMTMPMPIHTNTTIRPRMHIPILMSTITTMVMKKPLTTAILNTIMNTKLTIMSMSMAGILPK